MPAPVNVSSSAVVAATPEAVYDLVTDLDRMVVLSPETVSAEWLDGATGPAVGARFVGRNKRGVARWSTKPEVLVADRGRCFSFKVPGTGGARWTYTFEAVEGGTKVTESAVQTEVAPLPLRAVVFLTTGIRDRGPILQSGIEATLVALRQAVSSTTSAA